MRRDYDAFLTRSWAMLASHIANVMKTISVTPTGIVMLLAMCFVILTLATAMIYKV